MGYDLHITRAEFWSKNEASKISEIEWLEYVKTDPELKLAGYNGPYFAIWSGKSEYVDPWFDLCGGNIYSKNPDGPIIGKMLEIAKKLNAKVQGDDYEVYFGASRNMYKKSDRDPF